MDRARRVREPVRVQDVGEQLEALDQARAGAGEVAGGVDRDDAAGAERRQLLGVRLGLLERALGVVAARHHDHDLRLRGPHLVPRSLLRVLAGPAEHVEPARVLDQLRRPVAGDEHRVEPLERSDRHRLGGAHREPHAVDPRRRVAHQIDAGVLGVGRLRERSHVAQHLAERVRVERDHLGLGIEPLGDRAHVVVRDRADGAQRLGDDQVGLQAPQGGLVELVDRAALLGQRAHGAVDLVRRQAGPDHVARHLRQVERLRRMVALVGDGGDLVADTEREQHLGGRGHERDDPHRQRI